MEAVRTMQEDVAPVLRVEWIGADPHVRRMAALPTTGWRELSLVDCSSFHAMRRLGQETAFAFDAHFAEQAFELTPMARSVCSARGRSRNRAEHPRAVGQTRVWVSVSTFEAPPTSFKFPAQTAPVGVPVRKR